MHCIAERFFRMTVPFVTSRWSVFFFQNSATAKKPRDFKLLTCWFVFQSYFWSSTFGASCEIDKFNADNTQSALELSPSHCPKERLVQDLGFGGFAFALKLPELLN